MNEIQLLAAKLFCVGFEGTAPSTELLELQRRGVSGAILFARNIDSPAQAAALTTELKALAPGPFLTSVDQEGGRVMRLRDPFTPLPPMRLVGQAGDPELACALGRAMGLELRELGFDLDFAPVLDVDTNPDNPVIGDRSFARDPAQVAALGVAMIEGLQGAGVAACGKHFPGHGDTSQDSHLVLPSLPHPMERLEEVELVPFRAAIEAGVASIMTAHVIFEALDPRYPATMTRPALDGILRDRLGFEGVVISDDLEMKAIADNFGIEEAVIRGVNAGVDLFLVCHTPALQHEAIDALIHAVEDGRVERSRLEEAAARIDRLVARYVSPALPLPASPRLGCDEHLAIVTEIRERAGAPAEDVGVDPTLRA